MTQIKNRTLPEEQPAGRQPRGENAPGSEHLPQQLRLVGAGNRTSLGLAAPSSWGEQGASPGQGQSCSWLVSDTSQAQQAWHRIHL